MRVAIVSIVVRPILYPLLWLALPRGQSERLNFSLAKRASVFAGLLRFLAFASFYPPVLPVFFLFFFLPLLINASYVYASCLGAASLGSSGSQDKPQREPRKSVLRA